MDNLTTSQIEDFNNPLAFARAREARIGQTAVELIQTGKISTGNIEASFQLVTGAGERLETLEGNLQTMLDLALSGERAGGNERKLQEAYGKLRSLSAGFDQVVDAIKFDGQAVFVGEKTYLSLGSGVRPLELDLAKLHTYGEDSLNLSQSESTAKASISYQTDDLIVNDSYDVIGLDIEEATFIAGSNPALELENGTYKVAISYTGATSSVEIRTTEGTLIERKDDVDLSGSGREWVDFDNGIRLSFEKESLFTSFDKYDFETNGSAELSATLTYERINAHVLRTGEAPEADSVSFSFTPSLSDGSGSLTLSDPVLSAVDTEKTALDSGFYNLEIEYHGENSIVRLTDSFGRLKAFDYSLDLSGDGSKELDLGVGFSVSIDRDQFSIDGASLTTPVNFQRKAPAIEDFDFRQYREQIEEAISIVQEQQEMISEASDRILEVNQLRNSANTSGIPTSLAFNSTGALSILTGGGDNSVFKSASSEARLNTLATQLFTITTALPTQANQTPQQLASLQNAATSNSWLGTFS